MGMWRRGALTVAAAAAVILAVLAVRAAVSGLLGPPNFDDRVMAIAAQVRCPVCNGESAAQSDSKPSLQIRDQIAQGLEAGLSQQQILARITAEYGTWILYRPPVRGPLAAAWYFPAAAVTLMFGLVLWYLRRREVAPAVAAGDPLPAGPGPPDGGGAEGTPSPDGADAGEAARRLRRFL